MKKKEYKAPAVLVTEICECKAICSSIPIDDEETNSGGRIKRKERDLWKYEWK